ncbi:hypothetical protein WJX81_000728 [Elliptochloris bilobata]|uniref:Uncharacterized protein n=1 Tax=Elliptochloris bilobata TaxID=381761 RepID=A0AAW1RXY3_9CHLO
MRPSAKSRVNGLSNIDSFLVHTAPSCVLLEEDKGVPVFSLSSLWSHGFEEASAYGSQVPLSCFGASQVSQVYTPSLSAIRLFASDAHSSRDSREYYTSDEDRVEAVCSDSSSSCSEANTSDSEDGNCDLHPSSWIAVAWYPLYALNKVAASRRDLNACFLTFHALGGAPAAGHSAETELAFARRRQAAGANAAFLPAFAFVPYKMQGRLWAEDERSGSVHAGMAEAALRLHEELKSRHSDLVFFLQNSPARRREASHF